MRILSALLGATIAGVVVAAAVRARAVSRDHVVRPFARSTAGDDDLMPFPSFAAMTDSLERDVDRQTSIPSLLPTIGPLSSPFSLQRYHPIRHALLPHRGIDIAAPIGAAVVAPAAGIVITVASRTGYGLVLEIDHGHGVITRYGHLSRVQVRTGDAVTRGQLVASVGSSGLSTGPHLHYEIHVAGHVVDPRLVGP